MKLVTHTLVKNEQRWLWFAITSVLEHVDEMLIWDTGSTDQTVDLIKHIHSPKIKFKEIGSVDPATHSKARQAMLDQTQADWLMILDGDEIWWQDSLVACKTAITTHPDKKAIISPFINLVGDIYHHQPPSGSHYKIAGYTGPYNLRFINAKIPGLHVGNPHGKQEYKTSADVPLQNLPPNELQFVDAPYLHTTHLPRSKTLVGDTQTLKRGFKYRYELGSPFPHSFVYPEVVYLPRPSLVPDPFFHRSLAYTLKSAIIKPLRFVKTKLITPTPHGY